MGKKRVASDEEADTPRKRNGADQSNLDSFFKSPATSSKKHKKQASLSKASVSASSGKHKTDVKGKGKSSTQAIEVIDLSSGDEKPVASTSKIPAATTVKPEVVDVKPDVKPALPKNIIGFAHNTSTAPGEAVIYPLDKDIFNFNPLIDIDSSSWPKSGQEIPYSFLTAAFVLISATRSRLIIVTVLTNTLRTIVAYQPQVLLSAVYLITNHVAPAYEGVELGLGSQVLSKALKDSSGRSSKELGKLWNTYGDMGDVAFHAKSSVRTLLPTPPLSISGVYSTLLKICALKGNGVTNQKAALVQKMLVAAKGEEVRFLGRTLVAHLRIGAVRLTVTNALARTFCLAGPDAEGLSISPAECDGLKAVAKTVKEGKDDPRRKAVMEKLARAEGLMRKVYVRHPNYTDIIPALLQVGLGGLEEAVPLSVGTPLSNMLGQITRNLEDVQSRLQPNAEFAAEWKYDGQRVQIHARLRGEDEKPEVVTSSSVNVKGKGGKWVGENQSVYVRLFSRHLEDMTDKYPDILGLVPLLLTKGKVESFVADAEIVAIDAETGALQNFQTLSNRARKDVQIGDVKVNAKIFAFDLMHLNGRSLLNETFRTRRELLHEHFPPLDPEDPALAKFGHVASILSTAEDLTEVQAWMAEATSNKCEGLMIKILDHEIPADGFTPAKEEAGSEELFSEDDMPDVAPSPKGKKAATSPAKKSRKKLLLASYTPDKRADAWMKVKKDYSETGGDSLDLVPIGAWHGQGRKAGWWSPILLGVYDPLTESYQAVCKCISGFTDQFYKDLNDRYPKDSESCGRVPFARMQTGLTPQWYFKPNEVWEIRGADITLSPVYPAARGLIAGERGLSIRFPRFMKLRDDKGVEQATTPQEFAAAYQRQESGPGSTSAPKAAAAMIESGEEEEEVEEEEVPDTMDFAF